jgi:pimeloyl-ACP methyl ester carboxylesterase
MQMLRFLQRLNPFYLDDAFKNAEMDFGELETALGMISQSSQSLSQDTLASSLQPQDVASFSHIPSAEVASYLKSAKTVSLPSKVQTGNQHVDTIKGLYIPVAEAKTGAVVLHGFGMGKHWEDMLELGILFHRQGISTLHIDLPYHGERSIDGRVFDPFDETSYPHKTDVFALPAMEVSGMKKAIEQGVSDIGTAKAYLFNQGLEKVVVAGFSLGATLGVVHLGREDHVSGVYAVFGGGDLAALAHYSSAGERVRSAVKSLPSYHDLSSYLAEFEPWALAANIDPAKLLMVNGARDYIIPRKNVERLIDAMPVKPNINWVDTDRHYDKPAIFSGAERFISERCR